MPKFLSIASYTSEGAKGLMRDSGTGRRRAIEQLAESLGGRVEAFYFAFGESDVYIIADFPDNQTAAAVSLAVNASGAATNKQVVLLTAEEVDEAVQKTVDYRPPGA